MLGTMLSTGSLLDILVSFFEHRIVMTGRGHCDKQQMFKCFIEVVVPNKRIVVTLLPTTMHHYLCWIYAISWCWKTPPPLRTMKHKGLSKSILPLN
jgi:hypothetical protein